MATQEEIIELERALKEEVNKDPSQLEKKEEVSKEVEEKVEEKEENIEGTVSKEEKVEETVDEKEEESESKEKEFTPSERVQARFDALTERLIEKDKKLAELEKKLQERTPVKEESKEEVTKDQILALLQDESQKQYHAWAYQQLAKMEAKEAMTESENKQKMAIEQERHLESVKKSYIAATTEFPDMKDDNSELWKKANEIYIAKKLDRDPDGQYIAAVLASRQLESSNTNTTSKEILEKRLAKETGKKSLASSSRKTIVSNEDRIAKLEKEAFKAGFGTPESNAFLKALEEERLAKKKK